MITFILICAGLLGLYVAWNIGANDVANAVGTAVGSGALTLKYAVIIAAIFEFCGAFFLGSEVSETLEGGMIHLHIFEGRLFDYVIGMLCALFATGVWLQLASYFGWPVSTTHAIVGAVVGFGLIEGGVHAIVWSKFISIVLSWVVSPVLGGVLAYLLFLLIRRLVFFQKQPFIAMKRWFPFLLFTVFFVMLCIVLFGHVGSYKFSLLSAVGLAALIALPIALIGVLIKEKLGKTLSGFSGIEKMFGFLQIIIACFMSLAHGSNDVANAIGPLAGIINVLQGKDITMKNTVSTWFLLLGGIGIVIGLATWGWRVIETVGKKITQLTPSRGFAAGFASAITIVFASKLGLPISTTHVVVGSVLGVGFARGLKALDLNTIRDIFISWVVTVPTSAIVTAVCFYLLKTFI